MKTKSKYQDAIQYQWMGYAHRYTMASSQWHFKVADMFKEIAASQTYNTLQACVYEIEKLLEYHGGTNSIEQDYQHGHFDGIRAALEAIVNVKPLEIDVDE